MLDYQFNFKRVETRQRESRESREKEDNQCEVIVASLQEWRREENN